MANTQLLANVQGDILLDGFPKRNESFFLFTINDNQVQAFCNALPKLAEQLADSQRTAEIRAQIKKFKADNPGKDADTIPTVGACIAFSRRGLDKMDTVLRGLKVDKMGDPAFASGMKAVAKETLQDPLKNGQPNYEKAFMSPDKLHGVILVAGNTTQIVKNKLGDIKKFLGGTVSEIETIEGKVRPGDVNGHEHFGYEDGISQPAVKGVDATPVPQQGTIRPGIALCGRDGDSVSGRPSWTKDGSFMCFRKLEQDVPGWDQMLKDVSKSLGMTNSEQLGARLIGRWKSGCPVALSKNADDPKIAKDPKQVNNFTYKSGDLSGSRQVVMSIRKTFPRGDLNDSFLESTRILRRGIPYGSELNGPNPTASRGLLFVCYQSNIQNGYQFIQQTWANSRTFFAENAGLDAVMGQSNAKEDNDKDNGVPMGGLHPDKLGRVRKFKGINNFVIPNGGEYFFMPSMSALKGALAGAKPKGEL